MIGVWARLIGLCMGTACLGVSALAQTLTYSDSSTLDRLRSNVGIQSEQGSASVRAEVTLLGDSGQTRVLPPLNSAWLAPAAGIGDDSPLSRAGRIPATAMYRPAVESRLLVRPGTGYIDGIEATARWAGGATTESLQLNFADLATGWRILGGSPLAIKSNFRMRTRGAHPEFDSRITSAFGVGRSLNVQTMVRFQDDGGALSHSIIDTKLAYRSPVPFIRRFEGDLRRTAMGEHRQSLSVLFPELSGGESQGPAFRLSGAATLSEHTRPNGFETRLLGLETRFSGTMVPLVGGRSALRFRLERPLDDPHRQRSTLALDHSWAPGDESSVGLKLELRKRLEQLETSMDLQWTSRF